MKSLYRYYIFGRAPPPVVVDTKSLTPCTHTLIETYIFEYGTIYGYICKIWYKDSDLRIHNSSNPAEKTIEMHQLLVQLKKNTIPSSISKYVSKVMTL